MKMRHGSLHYNVPKISGKFERRDENIRREISLQKIKVNKKV